MAEENIKNNELTNNENNIIRIKDLNAENEKKSRTIFRKQEQSINSFTGEITSSNNIIVTKMTKKDDFVKVFVENIDYINCELEKNEKQLMWCIFTAINYENLLYIPSLMSYATSKAKMTIRNYYRAKKSLMEKEILLKIDDELAEQYSLGGKNKYLLVNPNIFGKGSFRDLSRLRQTIIKNFDFNTLEYTKEAIKEEIYNEAYELEHKPEDFEIHKVEQKITENESTLDICVAKKDIINVVDDVVDINIEKEEEKEKNKEFINSINILTSELLDRIKVLESTNRQAEADILNSRLISYLDKISKFV